MANKYNFSVQRMNNITGQMETYAVEGMGSFDEARNEVEKGLRDQRLAEDAYTKSHPNSSK